DRRRHELCHDARPAEGAGNGLRRLHREADPTADFRRGDFPFSQWKGGLRMKILSVDDKAENLYMLEALLRGHGHEVDSASDGQAALPLTQSSHYDLIISDILMPRMDGFQLCRELKKDAHLRYIPFIF